MSTLQCNRDFFSVHVYVYCVCFIFLGSILQVSGQAGKLLKSSI